MLVEEVMTREVKTIKPSGTVLDAAKLMTEFHVGCLVVSPGDKLVGIITDSDILERVVAEDKLGSKVKVRDAMTSDPVLIDSKADVSDAARIMTENRIKRLPVIHKDSLVGILTASDLAGVGPEILKQISSLIVFPKKGKSLAG
jgi:CBS domain-containing protein